MSSCIRSSVRAISIPPLSMNTPRSLYWRMLSSVSSVISFEWSTGKMKFDACPVEPPGFGSGPLSIIVMSRHAEARQVVREAVADDPRADDDDSLVVSRAGHALVPLLIYQMDATGGD